MSYTLPFLLISLSIWQLASPHQRSPSNLTLHISTPSQQTSTGLLHNTRRSPFTSLHLPLLVFTLALCGGVHSNPDLPGPSYFELCIYNISCLLSTDHISNINDLIKTHHPNIIVLTGNWTKNKSFTHFELANVTQSGYTLHLLISN